MTEQALLLGMAESEIGAHAFREIVVPDVALAVLHNRLTDKILLIRRSREAGFAGWAFPGGKIERNGCSQDHEDPVHAARRELKEETGLVVTNGGKEIFCRKHPSTGVIVTYVYFRCEHVQRCAGASNLEPAKADDCAWVELEKIDRLFRGGLSEGVVRGIRRQLGLRGRKKGHDPQTSLELEQQS